MLLELGGRGKRRRVLLIRSGLLVLSHVGMTFAQLQKDKELEEYWRSYSHLAFYWWILSRGLAFIVIKLGSERIRPLC